MSASGNDRPAARWEAFGRAFGEAIVASGKTQSEIADALGVSQPTVSEWRTGKSQPARPEVTFALEDFLDQAPGNLSQHLGYIPTTALKSWESAIATLPNIDDQLKNSIIAIVRAMTQG